MKDKRELLSRLLSGDKKAIEEIKNRPRTHIVQFAIDGIVDFRGERKKTIEQAKKEAKLGGYHLQIMNLTQEEYNQLLTSDPIE